MSSVNKNYHQINDYLESNVKPHKNKTRSTMRLVFCLALFIASAILQAKSTGTTAFSGIVAQFQVLLSVFMILGTTPKAYIFSISINAINSFIVFIGFTRQKDTTIIPGIIIPLITILVILIIQYFSQKLNKKINEVIQKNDELGMLYEEIVATEEELEEQNRQLHEYNHLMRLNEEKLNYLAFFDSLTELPNRKMVLDRLELLIKVSQEKPLKFALIFIDLDNFKKVNDSLGHAAGDVLLQTAVDRLKSVIYPEDLLGRLGGDEFALIIQRPTKEAELLAYAEQMKDVLLDTFIIENASFNISASFGIALYPQDGRSAIEIMKAADTAMYKIKDQGRNGVQFFSIEMKNEVLKKIEFENQLRYAIEHGELHLLYQPQYTPHTKELRGLEVLARWQSSTLGFVSPTQFIPIAEDTGLIIPMGEWIIRTACTKLKDIHTNYNTKIVMSINISAIQIMDPHFVATVSRIIKEVDCDPSYIEFEVTESVFISNMDYVIGVLTKLKELGIRIALDDFGTGYSSLNYLQLLPIDTLKVDKSFISSIDNQDARKPIVGSIISLVHQMNMTVVAEGVETATQLDYLKNESCDYVQGFYWSKPISESDVNQLLLTN